MMSWYILSFIIVLIAGPKAFSMDNAAYKEWKYSKILRKHVVIAVIIALMPVINILASIVILGVLGIALIDSLDSDHAKDSWLNKPLFKDKN